MKTDVICIGLTCADVLIRGIDFSSPFIAETKPAKEVSFHVGGDAANQAIVLSHMGINTELVTGLGKGLYRRFLCKYILEEQALT